MHREQCPKAAQSWEKKVTVYHSSAQYALLPGSHLVVSEVRQVCGVSGKVYVRTWPVKLVLGQLARASGSLPHVDHGRVPITEGLVDDFLTHWFLQVDPRATSVTIRTQLRQQRVKRARTRCRAVSKPCQWHYSPQQHFNRLVHGYQHGCCF